MHRNPEIHKIGSGTKHFITFLSLFFDMRRERDIISFYADFSIWPPPRVTPAANYWSGLGEFQKSTCLVQAQISTHWLNQRVAHFVDSNWSRLGETKNRLPSSRLASQLTVFFSNLKILSSSLLGMTSFTSPVLFPIWGFYCYISDCYICSARAWTPSLNMCT